MRVNKRDYDFAGWVTKNDVKCSDGRTIRQNAFAHMDGKTVPLVYNHNHNDIDNVLGHVLLENRREGVYGYAKTNSTGRGTAAKECVRHGDIVSFSIYANHLTETNSGDVMHGDIKEVSLVLAGANEEALIDTFFEHGAEGEEGMLFYMGENDSDLTLYHKDSDDDDEEDKDKEDKEEKEEEAEEESKEESEEEEDDDKEEKKKMAIQHADEESKTPTLKEAYEKMPEEYKKVCAAMVGIALEEQGNDSEAKHSDEGGEIMKTNVFENDQFEEENVLSHSDMEEILTTAKTGSKTLKQAFSEYCLAHSIDTTGMNILPSSSTAGQTYGVRDLDMLLPEYKAQSAIPEWIKRDTTWADVVMAGVKKVPFKRLKSMFANITEDEARAKGYIKGDQKATEVFELLGRTTDPQTIYKLQELDRDDIVDIEDFDVVAWIKGEMNIMLNEEKARAILIGDGRSSSSRYKIKEDHVRSIVNDVPLFNIKVTVPRTGDVYRNFIKSVLRARKNYKGSGNPTLFTTEDVLTECLLLEDGIGHPLYKTEQELATKLRVSRIVTVEVMEGQQVDGKDLMGVIVNLNDYTIGGDGAREKGMFEDFDIDFNQYKYLIETRMSGALMRPYSAMTITLANAEQSGSGQQGQG